MNYISAGIISLFLMSTPQVPISPLGQNFASEVRLSDVNYSLQNRYTNTYVNDVFSDNILLTLAYMRGKVKKGDVIAWDQVRSPFVYKLQLKPGQTFAFHDRVQGEYLGPELVTTNAHFNSGEGFRSDGWLVGDGVCHLASFINVAARHAGLDVEAPTRHDFAKIADVPKEYGVSIYYDPNGVGNSERQNLYITNNKSYPIEFVFTHQDNALDIEIQEVVS